MDRNKRDHICNFIKRKKKPRQTNYSLQKTDKKENGRTVGEGWMDGCIICENFKRKGKSIVYSVSKYVQAINMIMIYF